MSGLGMSDVVISLYLRLSDVRLRDVRPSDVTI